MRSPQDARFQKVQSLMKTGQMVGRDRPVGRVTWAKGRLLSTTSSKPGVGEVRYLDKSVPQYEMFTVRSIDISRSIGQDAATCTITLWNARSSTTQPEGLDTAGTAGYLTPGRGTSRPVVSSVYTNLTASDDVFGNVTVKYPTDWQYAENPYRDVFIPNTVIRTYQGYGSDNFDVFGNFHDIVDADYVAPENDTQLYSTGVWLIDKVTINANGTMSLECRDLAKLLIEQYIYPPMIPIDRFPLIYAPAHDATGHKESIGKNVATFHSSSVDAVYGKDASVSGHKGSHAFDGNSGTLWLSGPNNTGGDLEWIQGAVHGDINEIVLNCWNGDYIIFVCVHENGKWQGTSTVSGKVETSVKKNNENLTVAEGNGAGGFFYVITKGDTLWDLAGKYYGDNLKWPVIAQANSNIIKDPHWIYPGQKIKIPYVAGTLSPPTGSSASSGGLNSGYPTTYTVVTGDTLWDIADHYYDDPTRWPVIYQANTNVIKDPHWIYPGQKFHIPYIPGTPFSPPSPSVPAAPSGGTGGQNVEIPYVLLATVPKSGQATISLPRTYKADYVRIVFTNLSQSPGSGSYRAGVRELVARNHIANTYVASTIGKAGYIQDWTEPIKEMCAWSGLTWVNPPAPTPADPVLKTTSVSSAAAPHMAQPEYGIAAPSPGSTVNLRAWGDFEFLGAGPVVATPGDYFMSKSFMDGIRQITDFIGGIFYIDESGGAQFRLPNIWSGGNFIDDTAAASSLGARFSDHPIEFHESANLVEYEMVISDEALRSEILVIGGYPSVNATGPVAGGYVLGYDSATGTTSAIDFSNILGGQYRLMIVPGDSTKLFYTEAECQRMAELTALFILFTYRQGTLKAPCHPALQIDDQIRIFERVTNETYIHYVSSLDTHMDLESGEYTMQATTHWLGSDPDTDWFVNKQNLTPAVKELPAILKRVGREAGGDTFEQPPYGVS